MKYTRWIFLSLLCVASRLMAQDSPPPGGVGAPPDGAPPGALSASTAKVSLTEGDWSFDLVTTSSSGSTVSSATITYYAGKTNPIVIVPSILGGAPVTKIASQAFGHHGEISAVYVPASVASVADWGFYDLNEALIISFANPAVEIDDAAFQSSGNAALYLPSSTAQHLAGGKPVVSANTELLSIALKNERAAAIAGGTYLNVYEPTGYSLAQEAIVAMAKSATGVENDVSFSDGILTFSGEAYTPTVQKISIYEAFQNKIAATDLNKTFRSLTEAGATALNETIAADPSYGALSSILHFSSGYYLNGNAVVVDPSAIAWDVKSGQPVSMDADSGLFPSTGSGYYKYVAALDADHDGDIDTLYYSPYSLSYTHNDTTISSANANLEGLKARDTMNPVYLAFASAVLKATGGGIARTKLRIDTAIDGEPMDASANQERSLLWATDYGSIEVGSVQGVSHSRGNWGKMSFEAGLSAYNVEIIMEWGMNALLYATNGGSIRVGTPKGPRSTFYADGDGSNGIIAGGSGLKAGTADAPADTSSVYLYNAKLDLEGWNNHVADVVYGGYAYLEKIKATTGKVGSYAVGQGSALANDFGNGVVDAVDFHAVTYGNRSAGAYVIGGGVITARNSSFVSKMDAGLVVASGGTYKVENSSATGLIGLRNRGGVTPDATSTLTKVALKADKDIASYVTGNAAAKAIAAWKSASGGLELMHFMMSDPEMTLGTLCANYHIPEAKKAELLTTLGNIARKRYTDATPLRNSVLDNSYYNYSAGAYVGNTDFSDVPYLTVGSAFGGLVSSVLEFESSGINLNLNSCSFKNTNKADYRYLIASEAGSAPVITFTDSRPSGLIWNEGDVDRAVEGRPGARASTLSAIFVASHFTGSFADGSNGLWTIQGLSYVDSSGVPSSLNGNYYGAQANWGISARFDSGSSWTVTRDSYLGELTIESGAKIKAPSGYTLRLTVNGVPVDFAPGTYSGQVVVSLARK